MCNFAYDFYTDYELFPKKFWDIFSILREDAGDLSREYVLRIPSMS